MKVLRALAAAALLGTAPLASQAGIMVCYDSNSADGFQYVGGQCVVDNGAGDAFNAIDNVVSTAWQLGSTTVSIILGQGATSLPDLNLQLSVDGPVIGSYIIAVSQTDNNIGAATPVVASFSTDFTGSGPGSVFHEIFVDDLNRSLTSGAVGSLVASGGFGAQSGTATVTDPFSIMALMYLTSTSSAVWSTDITVRVPEPATLALLGLGLTGLAMVRRRRR